MHLQLEGEVGDFAVVFRDTICRELSDGPQPCSRRCVTVRPEHGMVAGLKLARRLLLLMALLFRPRATVVPVRNDCW